MDKQMKDTVIKADLLTNLADFPRQELIELRDSVMWSMEWDQQHPDGAADNESLPRWKERLDAAIAEKPPCTHPTPWRADDSEDDEFRTSTICCRECGEVMERYHFRKHAAMDSLFNLPQGPPMKFLGIVIPQGDGKVRLLRPDGTFSDHVLLKPS